MFFSSIISVECVVAYEASSSLDDGAKVINAENRLFTWQTPPPSRPILWGQIGNECVYSMPHIDAGGYASAVEMCFGDKLWFVARFSAQNLKRRPEKCAKWECVRLECGHRLYMPPGMLHFEITIKDSFEMGRHFFTQQCETPWKQWLRNISMESLGRMPRCSHHQSFSSKWLTISAKLYIRVKEVCS